MQSSSKACWKILSADIFICQQESKTMMSSISKAILCIFIVDISASTGENVSSVVKVPSICGSNRNITLAYELNIMEMDRKSPKKMNEETIMDFNGFCADIFSTFLKWCPLRYKLIEVGEGEKSNLRRLFGNDTLSIISLINVAQMSTTDFDVAIFSQPVSILPVLMVYIDEAIDFDNGAIAWDILWTFLDWKQWLMLLGTLVFGAVATVFVGRLEDATDVGNGGIVVSDTVWNYIFLVFGLGEGNSRPGLASRLMIIIWAMTFFLGLTIFAAHVSSNMTVERLTKPIRSLEELAESDVPFFADTMLLRQRHTTIMRLKERFDWLKDVRPELETLTNLSVDLWGETTENLLKEGFVLLTWVPIMQFQVPQRMLKPKCHLMTIKDYDVAITLHHAFRHDETELLNAFNHHLQQMVEDGRMDEISRSYAQTRICEGGKEEKGGGAGIRNKMRLAGYLGVAGSLATMSFALVQYGWRRCKGKWRKRETTIESIQK